MTYRTEEPTAYPDATQQQCPECHRELRADCCDVEILRRECAEFGVTREVERILLGMVRAAEAIHEKCSIANTLPFDRGHRLATIQMISIACEMAGIGHADAMLRRRMVRDQVAR